MIADLQNEFCAKMFPLNSQTYYTMYVAQLHPNRQNWEHFLFVFFRPALLPGARCLCHGYIYFSECNLPLGMIADFQNEFSSSKVSPRLYWKWTNRNPYFSETLLSGAIIYFGMQSLCWNDCQSSEWILSTNVSAQLQQNRQNGVSEPYYRERDVHALDIYIFRNTFSLWEWLLTSRMSFHSTASKSAELGTLLNWHSLITRSEMLMPQIYI
jgi:hypothetical protein